jgi:hypothetical protein
LCCFWAMTADGFFGLLPRNCSWMKLNMRDALGDGEEEEGVVVVWW